MEPSKTGEITTALIVFVLKRSAYAVGPVTPEGPVSPVGPSTPSRLTLYLIVGVKSPNIC